MKRFYSSALCLLLCCHLEARPVAILTPAELTQEATHVVIIQPDSVKRAKDIPSDGSFGDRPMDRYVPLETTCRVEAVLKGELTSETLQILHYQYVSKMEFNGAIFITFFFPPANLASYPTDKDGKVGSDALKYGAYASSKPRYLAFLRRLPDGHFVPVTPQYDAGLSVKLLTDPFMGGGFRGHPDTRPVTPEDNTDSSTK